MNFYGEFGNIINRAFIADYLLDDTAIEMLFRIDNGIDMFDCGTFSYLFQNLGNDLVNFPSGSSSDIIVTGTNSHNATEGLDILYATEIEIPGILLNEMNFF